MARPKSEEPAASAVYKIEKAFWELLEKRDFSEITMQVLAREAGINRNSLYYHYGNMQEVAEAAFGNVLSDEASMAFMDMLLAGPAEIVQNWEPMGLTDKIRKVHLFARSNSPLLRSLLEKTLISRWFRKLGIQREALSPEELLRIDYISNGFIGILGNRAVADDPRILASFPGSPIGKAAIQTMQQMTKGGDK